MLMIRPHPLAFMPGIAALDAKKNSIQIDGESSLPRLEAQLGHWRERIGVHCGVIDQDVDGTTSIRKLREDAFDRHDVREVGDDPLGRPTVLVNMINGFTAVLNIHRKHVNAVPRQST